MATCALGIYDAGTKFYRDNQTESLERSDGQDGNDWGNSIYFFLEKRNPSDEKKKLPSYKDVDHPYYMEFTNKQEIRYIKCIDECFKSGDYEKKMKDIISEIEELLGLKKTDDIPFMKWLGANKYAFQCYHCDNIFMEIGIPNELLEKSEWEAKALSELP